MKWRVGAIAIVCALACSGCFTLMALSLPNVTRAELERKYGPPEPHWTGAPLRPETLLVLSVQDPSRHDGRLIQATTAFAPLPVSEWLDTLGVRSLHVHVNPSQYILTPRQFYPRIDEPAGIYSFSHRVLNDPACEPYRAALAAHAAEGPAGERCIVYDYLGPLDLKSEALVYVMFEDADWPNATVMELRDRDNVVHARAVACADRYGQRRIEGCSLDTDLRRLLSGAGPPGN